MSNKPFNLHIEIEGATWADVQAGLDAVKQLVDRAELQTYACHSFHGTKVSYSAVQPDFRKADVQRGQVSVHEVPETPDPFD